MLKGHVSSWEIARRAADCVTLRNWHYGYSGAKDLTQVLGTQYQLGSALIQSDLTALNIRIEKQAQYRLD